MTISLDTPSLGNDENAGRGSRQEFEDCTCGDRLDWIPNGDVLSPSLTRSTDESGEFLTRVIEREIIPRLFLAHRPPSEPPKITDGYTDVHAIGDSDAFAILVLSSDSNLIMDQVQGLLDRGVGLRRIYLDLLAPVARKLGEFWEADRCSFTDVTLGLSRLQLVLREVGRRNGELQQRSTAKHRIFLVPAPGEQHTFGLSMVEEYFLHAGWETASDHTPTASSVLHTVSTQKIDVIGFSIGYGGQIRALMDLVKQARKAALNQDMAVMVGGKFVVDHPEIISGIKDVTMVANGLNAVDTAENLLPQHSQSVLQKPS